MATEVDEILRMADAVGPDIVHISTDPDAVGLAAMGELRKRLPPQIKIMKAIPVVGEEALELALNYASVSDYLLLDTKVHGLPGVGATGRTHDWNISRRIVEAVEIPVILAGGLAPENVAEAIRLVAPAGVDSNTATNLPNSPVEKDLQRVRRFVEGARLAGQELAGRED
jgi:phosphoribosylanthranilate isomerase